MAYGVGTGMRCGVSTFVWGIDIWCGISSQYVGFRHMLGGFAHMGWGVEYWHSVWVSVYGVGFRYNVWGFGIWCVVSVYSAGK